MPSTKQFSIFLVGIISAVSLIACQKANADQSNTSDTKETQKTVLEMETHNSITKNEILNALDWLYQISEEKKAQ